MKILFFLFLFSGSTLAYAKKEISKSLIGKISNEELASKWDKADYCRFHGIEAKKNKEAYGLFISASDDEKKPHNKALMNLDGKDEILVLFSVTEAGKGNAKFSKVYKKENYVVKIEFDPQPNCKACEGSAIKVKVNVERNGVKASAEAEGFCAY